MVIVEGGVVVAKWIAVADACELSADSMKVVDVEQNSLVLCHLDGKLHALHNVCPHAGLPIGLGELNGCVLTCPFHGYAYNVQTGKNVDFEEDVPLQKLPVRIEGDRVLVDLEA